MMGMDQHTLTHGQARSLGQIPHMLPWQESQCAWCLAEQGLELGNGSHGICVQHATSLLQQWKEHHAGCSQQGRGTNA